MLLRPWFLPSDPSCASLSSSISTSSLRWRQKLFNSLDVAGRFVNPFIEWQDRNTADLFAYIRWQLTRNNRNSIPSDIKVETLSELERTLPLVVPDFDLLRKYTDTRGAMRLPMSRITHATPSKRSSTTETTKSRFMTVTWIGQSTCFVQMDGYNILTDPIFRTIGEWFGPKRIRPSPCALEDLPKIDIVLVSHNHYDHLDTAVVQKLGNSVTWYVPLGMSSWFASFGVTNVVELDWWQEHKHQGGPLTIIGTPIQHWSGRHFFDVNLTLWASFVVKGPSASFFHCGDTGYCQAFKEIGKRCGPITFAALPIGSYEPREFMKHQHMDPAEACLVHKDIAASFSLGVHWGTFMMSDEHYLDPPAQLEYHRIQNKLPKESVFTTHFGA
eukprot:jgi/Hompol1/1016/HPOL_002633-RA